MAATLLSACSSGIVPPGSGPDPLGSRVAPPRPATSSVRPRESNVPVRQPTPSTPMLPMAGSPVPAGVTTAAAAGLVAGPAVATLPVSQDGAVAALAAFRTSCPGLVRRTDASGLTRGSDWQPACDAARATGDRDARSFFTRWFETVQVADGRAFEFRFGPDSCQLHARQGGGVPVVISPGLAADLDTAEDLAFARLQGLQA